MAASTATFAGGDAMDAEALLVDDAVRGSVDFKDRPVLRSKTGCWKSASFIIGVEMAERFAYYGISSNLVIYLTGPLRQSTAAAAANVNAWSATASLSPLLGAFVADSFLGRFRTIIAASLLYILGLGSLSVSAALNSSDSSSPPLVDVIFFFIALYLVAFAVGGHKPCLQAFGADQFDEENEKELRSKSSFFNWWNFCLCVSVVVGLLVLTYIQENLSWELGFGIPCIVMCFALLVFLLGMVTYRFRVKRDERRNPFMRITRVFMEAVKNRDATRAGIAVEEEAQSILPSEGAQFRFLDQAILEENGEKVCSINDVEDAKAILKLLPICLACLPFAIVYSQSTTLFTKQGTTMDRHIISSDFQIPAAALQAFTPGSIILFVPFYERLLIPIARAIGHKPSLLQRIGSGLFLGIVCMVIAGLTERKRLETALEHGLVDLPEETVPMSVWWLVPQYLVMGIADVLTFVGLQEFFYDQVPGELKSMGLALSFCVAGIGGFLSSFLVSLVDGATGGRGGESWLSDNLNRAHLDYFYWLLGGLNVLSLILYVYFAKSYVYSKRITD
ncbi:Major facilitator superfamily protein [Perilla frutescens var. hirtella]|uniref:Major facilitator superfamily protein n=1 Tax=Perilla frutescens var. hirtella TaxID=608512 RepID=A0AAD4JHP1_PERFH|nr:Major facilitator superfamily protein [Perilla frutescens var. hirtella]